jgi:hypothetical protein
MFEQMVEEQKCLGAEWPIGPVEPLQCAARDVEAELIEVVHDSLTKSFRHGAGPSVCAAKARGERIPNELRKRPCHGFRGKSRVRQDFLPLRS